MGDHDEKSESELRMQNIEDRMSDMSSALNEIMACLRYRNDLGDRVKALEDILESRFAPNTAGHPNDGGWFD